MYRNKCNFAGILCQFFKEKRLLATLLCAFSLNKEFLMVPYQIENLHLIYC